jgi:hypothetical protein
MTSEWPAAVVINAASPGKMLDDRITNVAMAVISDDIAGPSGDIAVVASHLNWHFAASTTGRQRHIAPTATTRCECDKSPPLPPGQHLLLDRTVTKLGGEGFVRPLSHLRVCAH